VTGIYVLAFCNVLSQLILVVNLQACVCVTKLAFCFIVPINLSQNCISILYNKLRFQFSNNLCVYTYKRKNYFIVLAKSNRNRKCNNNCDKYNAINLRKET
jgi:hypothetical protein